MCIWKCLAIHILRRPSIRRTLRGTFSNVRLDMWHGVQTCGMVSRDVHRDTHIERVVETSMYLLDVCLDSMPHVYSHSMPQA